MSIYLEQLFGMAKVDYSRYYQQCDPQAQRIAQIAAVNRYASPPKDRVWACEYCGAEHPTTTRRCTCCGAHKRG